MRRVSCSVILFFCTVGLSLGDVLVSESFDYDAGPIDEQNGGEGWFDSWLVAESLFETDFHLDVVELDEPLIYALPEGGFINGENKALRFSNDSETEVLANETMGLTRGIDEVIDAEEVFFSFLYRYDGDGTETGGFIDDNDFVVWWFNGAGGPQLGLKGNFGNGDQPDDFVGRVSGAFAPPQQAYAPGIDISEEAGTLNDNWFLVGKMSKANNSDEEDDYDQFDLWVNPAVGDADSPDATGTGAAADALALELTSIGMRIFSEEPGDAMIWDELRIGATWEDVVAPIGNQDIATNVVLGDCNGDGVVNADDLQCACASGTLEDVFAATGLMSGDLNGDGEVAFTDFLALAANFGQTVDGYHLGDIDCNGEVAFLDFLALAQNFGQSNVAEAVPEPTGTTIWIPAVFGLILTYRFRRTRENQVRVPAE